MRAGLLLTPHRGWGIVRSMSSSFPFIIPLNYGIIAKNNLALRAEKPRPDTFILPVVKTTCCYYQKYSTTANFGRFWPILALLWRKKLINAFLYDFSTLFTRKYGQNKLKLAIQNPSEGDFRFSLPPAQESAPGNDGDVPADSKEAGISRNTAPPIRIQYS